MASKAARIAPGSSGNQANHFVPAFDSMPTLHGLNREVALQVAAFPLGPTATSIVFKGDGSVPASSARSATGYTNGARTLGRRNRSLAVTYQATTFDSYDDLDLRGDDINLFGGQACCSTVQSDRDMMLETLSLRLHRKVVGVVLGYGISDRLDVGLVVPFVEVAGDARITSRILRTATADDTSIHNFASGEDEVNYDPNLREIGLADRTIPGGRQPTKDGVEGSGASTARGFGDLVMRGKFRMFSTGAHSVAVGVDLRLPTGNRDELIGLGATQVSPAIMWSMDTDRASGRALVRYVQSFGSLSPLLSEPGIDLTVPNELGYEAGLDVDVAPRTTLVAEVFGRRLPSITGYGVSDVTFPSRGPGPLPSASFLATNALTAGSSRTINLALTAIGARFHLVNTVSATFRVLFSVGSSGLRPGTSGVVTMDYGF
jgi:hypothetical protein